MDLRCVLTITTLLCAAASPPVVAVSAGDTLPGFQVTATQDAAVSPAMLRGKVVLVNFWASWCPPCRDEMPELQKMHAAYKDQGFEVVGVNIDTQRNNATDFIQRHSIAFTVVFDPEQQVIRRFGAKAMPTSYLVDRDGMVRQVFHGYSAQKRASMEQAVAALVTVASAAANTAAEVR